MSLKSGLRIGGSPPSYQNDGPARNRPLSFPIFLALLLAAALHAGWNALVRRDADRNAAAIAVAGGGAVVSFLVLPFLPPIAAAAIPFVLMSSIIHILYYALIISAYRHGELSVVYPIMRGLAPLIVTVIGTILIEPATPAAFIGVAIVAVGITSLGVEGMRRSRVGIPAALANAVVIAGYTLVDGLGARQSGAPVSYTAWILVGGGVATVGWRYLRDGQAVVSMISPRIALGLAGGVMGLGAYGIALWAMTLAPIGAVAAVRESSVLFATALGAVLLHERFGILRWAAAVLVVAGLALIKLGG